jgi:hypothetical protein
MLATAPGAENVRPNGSELKRKRGDPPSKVTEVISLLEDSSEDEAALESKLNAIQSKIAGIRARTTHEDQLVPNKKQRSAPRPLRASQTISAIEPPLSQRAPPVVQNAVDFAESTFILPPSSQNPAHVKQGSTKPEKKSSVRNGAFGKTAADSSVVYGNTPVYAAGAWHPLESITPKVLAPPAVQQKGFVSSPSTQSSSQPVALSSPPSAQMSSRPVLGEVRTEPVLCEEQQKVVDLIMVSGERWPRMHVTS